MNCDALSSLSTWKVTDMLSPLIALTVLLGQLVKEWCELTNKSNLGLSTALCIPGSIDNFFKTPVFIWIV